MKRLIFSMILALIPGLANGAAITVYAEPDFRGEQRTFDTEVARLTTAGWDDRMASVRIQSGTWELCVGERFEECTVVRRDMADLATRGLAYRVSSLRPVTGPAAQATPSITAFTRPKFRGEQLTIDSDVPRLRELEWDDRIASLWVDTGQWEVCVSERYRECTLVTEDVEDLGSLDLALRISSVRLVDATSPQAPETPRWAREYSRPQAELVATRLYRALLGREPDPRGLEQAASRLQYGRSREQIDAILASDEYRRKQLPARDLLDQIYQGLLGRLPDEGAKGAYLERLRQGDVAGVVSAILESTEFERKLAR